MKAKLISIAALFLISAMSLLAQTTFGVQGGINFQNITGKDDGGDKLENDLTLGFHVGAIARIPVAPDFYFQPGLLFSTKGTKSDIPEYVKATSDKAVMHLSYIEVPLNFLFRPQLGSGHILLGFGPYLAYGISGKITSDNASDVDVVFKNKVPSTADDSKMYMKGFDAGANIFFGYELSSGLFFQLNTQMGLLNLEPEYEGYTDDETVLKNTGFGLSLGFVF
jgi:hypothetical protein